MPRTAAHPLGSRPPAYKKLLARLARAGWFCDGTVVCRTLRPQSGWPVGQQRAVLPLDGQTRRQNRLSRFVPKPISRGQTSHRSPSPDQGCPGEITNHDTGNDPQKSARSPQTQVAYNTQLPLYLRAIRLKLAPQIDRRRAGHNKVGTAVVRIQAIARVGFEGEGDGDCKIRRLAGALRYHKIQG